MDGVEEPDWYLDPSNEMDCIDLVPPMFHEKSDPDLVPCCSSEQPVDKLVQICTLKSRNPLNNLDSSIMKAFIMPLRSTCKACVVMDDDELNTLPLSSHIRSVTQVPTKEAKRDITSLKDAKNVRGRKRGAKSAIIIAFLLLGFCGFSTCAPLLTIQSPDGDIIDCINTLDQPSLKSSLLKNHVFQDYPSGMKKTEEEGGFGSQVWHRNGTACPHGTFPIRRVEAEAELVEGKYGPLISDAAHRATQGHQYAVGYVEGIPIYGGKATLNVWSPVVESGDDFSLAQIWITSGSYENEDLNTLEAGWQVYPTKYGDHQPRLFTYWTSDAYLSSGCYNHYGKGFVQVNRHVALGGAIAGTSTIGGDQFDITLQIWKDPLSGHWWLGMDLTVVPIGYWPVELFTRLSDLASEVQWGGEVVYLNSTRMSNITQMGSGEFPGKEFRRAAYVCNPQIAEKNRSFLPPREFHVGATQPVSYGVARAHSRDCGDHFYYGGPGPLRSSSYQSDPLPFLFLFLAVYFVV